jgi:hypothetical protein
VDTREPFVWRDFLVSFFAYYYWVFILIASAATAQVPIIATYPIVPCLLFIFVFGHNTINVQVSHVTHQTYSPFTRIYVFACTTLTLNALVYLLAG